MNKEKLIEILERNEDIIDDYYDYFMCSPTLENFKKLGGILLGANRTNQYQCYSFVLEILNYDRPTPCKTFVLMKGDDEVYVGTKDDVCKEFKISNTYFYEVLNNFKTWKYTIKERTFEDYLKYLKGEKENESN